MRRLRKNEAIRDLISETKLSVKDLIMPYFIIEGKNKKEPIKSMPGIFRFSIDSLLKDIEEARSLGIEAVLIFGVGSTKDNKGSEAYNKKGIVQRAIRQIKEKIRDIVVISDVCLCGYTSHGHCGIAGSDKSDPYRMESLQKCRGLIYQTQNFYIDDDTTLKILAKIAVSHAEAGADFAAPSAMMDGQVGAIREALDKNGFKDAGILAYSAKYASNFYGPFREALDSAPRFGDRKTYQMDFRNSDEALREIRQDIDEGADIVMVKPALAYLDVIQKAKQNFNAPIAAYNVSGEYAMVKNYSHQSPVTSHRLEIEKDLVLEVLTAIKRAGADLIITYHAKEAAKWLNNS